MNNYPLVLPHATVRRMLDRKATALIHTRQIKHGVYDVQDQTTVEQNRRRRASGRFDQQTDPSVFSVDVGRPEATTLVNLNLGTVRASGFKTQRDFYDDWLEQRGQIVPDLLVLVYPLTFVEPGRFLHRRVHRGYTTNPALAVRDEPEALSRAELNDLAAAARRRLERERREDLRRERVRSIRQRLKLAERSGSADAMLALSRELERLAEEMRAA